MNKLRSIFCLSPNYQNRVFGLDLMRALAIIFVVMGHGSFMLEKAGTDFPWIPLIDGVELFFVLSGFLIGGILIKTFIQTEDPKPKTIWNFWIRRWFRTLPNYYLILILNIVFVYFGIIKEDINQFSWKFFFFLQNFAHGFYDFFWESWSLSIEEWFYLLFPLILALNYLFLKKIGVSKKHIFLSSVIIFLVSPIILRWLIAANYTVNSFWLVVNINKVVIFRFDGIALGLLAAYIHHWHPISWRKSRNLSFTSGIIICYVILYTPWEPNAFSTKVFRMTLQSIGCFLLLPKFESLKTAPTWLTKPITHISLISYSMYLINLALISEVIRDNFPPHGPKTALGMYGIFWVAVIGFSTLLYKYYEKPILDLRDRWK